MVIFFGRRIRKNPDFELRVYQSSYNLIAYDSMPRGIGCPDRRSLEVLAGLQRHRSVEMTSPVSGGYGLDGLSSEKLMRCISQDVLPQLQPDRENTKGRRIEAGCVNNKIQKRAVNPLTRHASRSVMRLDYHRRKLRGLLRYRIHHLTEMAWQMHGRDVAFERGISGLVPQREALPKSNLRTTP